MHNTPNPYIREQITKQIGFVRDALGQVTCPSCGETIVNGTWEQGFERILKPEDAAEIIQHGENCSDFLDDIKPR